MKTEGELWNRPAQKSTSPNMDFREQPSFFFWLEDQPYSKSSGSKESGHISIKNENLPDSVKSLPLKRSERAWLELGLIRWRLEGWWNGSKRKGVGRLMIEMQTTPGTMAEIADALEKNKTKRQATSLCAIAFVLVIVMIVLFIPASWGFEVF